MDAQSQQKFQNMSNRLHKLELELVKSDEKYEKIEKELSGYREKFEKIDMDMNKPKPSKTIKKGKKAD